MTKGFEEQDQLLTLKDFEALWICMAEFEGLGFYNGGREAGASQQHKHLQMVPLPLAPEGPGVPIEPLLAQAGANTIGKIPGFPFLHAFSRLEKDPAASPSLAARTTFQRYGDMLQSVGMPAPRADSLTRQALPYCFLTTREWMLVVPRSKEFLEDISLNSLAFAGSFFLWNTQQLERLKAVGPMHALKSVAAVNPRKSI